MDADAGPFDDFRRMKLRIGTVVSMEDYSEAEKIYVLKVDLGEGEIRTMVTNIRSYYPPEKMMGRKILIIANLKPANFRGVKSFGMFMAANDTKIGGNMLLLLDPSCDVPNEMLMSSGMETKGLRCEMKYLEKVTMKVARVAGGEFINMDIKSSKGASGHIAATIDGDRAVPLGDGKGCVMIIDRDITDGAPAL